MRIHPATRRIVHGIGGEGAYLDGAPLAAGGGLNGMPDWLGDEPIWCGVTGKPFAFLRGSRVGAWAGWTSQFGVVTSWGLNLPKAVLLDMAADGTVLVGDDYQSGRGISAYRKLGGEWHVPSARPEMRFPYSQAAILDEHTACWTENVNGRMVLKGFGLPEAPRLPWNVLHPGRLFRVNGAPWVVYLRGEDDRIITHPWDFQGRGFSVPGFGFGPDACFDDETLTLCWSSGAGEVPGDIHTQPFKLSELQEIPSVTTPIVKPNLSSKLVAGAWGTTSETPGNLSIGPDPTKAVICTIGEVGQVDPARLLALFTDEANIAKDRLEAEALKVPLAIYVDDRDYLARLPEIVAAVRDTPWIAIVQCYIDCRSREGERLEDFGPEVLGQVRGLPVPWIAAARCFTGSGAVPVPRVIAAMNALAPIVDLPSCLGPALFKWKRGDGVTGVPELLPAAEAWLKGTPTLQPNQARARAAEFYANADPQPEPGRFAITVHDYTTVATAPATIGARFEVEYSPGHVTVMLTLDGEVVASADQLSGWIGSVVTQPGEYRLGLTAVSNGRKTQTGAVRIVRVLPGAPMPEIPGITYPSQPGSGTAEGARIPSQQAADAARKEESSDSEPSAQKGGTDQ